MTHTTAAGAGTATATDAAAAAGGMTAATAMSAAATRSMTTAASMPVTFSGVGCRRQRSRKCNDDDTDFKCRHNLLRPDFARIERLIDEVPLGACALRLMRHGNARDG